MINTNMTVVTTATFYLWAAEQVLWRKAHLPACSVYSYPESYMASCQKIDHQYESFLCKNIKIRWNYFINQGKFSLWWQRFMELFSLLKLPPTCAILDTFTTRLGAELFRIPNKRLVSKKWPRWLTASCVSKPSSVIHLGHIITPVIENMPLQIYRISPVLNTL